MNNDNEISGKYDLDEYSKDEKLVWRIMNLLNERGMTIKDLSIKAKLPMQTVSSWLKKKDKISKGKKISPQVDSLVKVAEALSVTLDYLTGKQDCTTPEDSKINEMTKLSQSALDGLRKATKRIDEKGDISAEKKIAMANYLLKNMNKSAILENMYDYIFGGLAIYDTNNEPLGAFKAISISPTGKTKSGLSWNSILSNASLSLVLRNLSLMKTKQENIKAAYMEKHGKKDYMEWEGEHMDDIMRELDALYKNDEGVDNK